MFFPSSMSIFVVPVCPASAFSRAFTPSVLEVFFSSPQRILGRAFCIRAFAVLLSHPTFVSIWLIACFLSSVPIICVKSIDNI